MCWCCLRSDNYLQLVDDKEFDDVKKYYSEPREHVVDDAKNGYVRKKYYSVFRHRRFFLFPFWI